ncbi:MAG: putative metalloprotease CJM1_0395 family protein [Phycisphaerae bacterium]
MIEAVDDNRILAAFLGTGRTRGLGGRLFAVDPHASVTSQEGASHQSSQGAYPQPIDTFESGQRATDAGGGSDRSVSTSTVSGKELTEQEQAQVRKLKKRDAEVRRHEQSHQAAAGSAASGGPSFEYKTGPDGKRYAVGGEVQIDTSQVSGDPQATIEKMRQVRRAALAPGNPSAQDRAVAAQAQAAERKAQAELRKERSDSATAGSTEPGSGEMTQSASIGGSPQLHDSQSSTSEPSRAAGSPVGSSASGDRPGRASNVSRGRTGALGGGFAYRRPHGAGALIDLVA